MHIALSIICSGANLSNPVDNDVFNSLICAGAWRSALRVASMFSSISDGFNRISAWPHHPSG